MGTGCAEDSFLGTGQTAHKQLGPAAPGHQGGRVCVWAFSLGQDKLAAWRGEG